MVNNIHEYTKDDLKDRVLSNPAFGWGDEQQFQFQFKHSVYDLMMFGNVSFRLKPL